ncbi:MAG: hypothetical protein AAGM36_00005, partial [Cyanobacteria bacterium J06597_1]
MCGIVGYIGHQAAVSILLDGLRKLEYRGYDSAGIALIEDSNLYRVRAKGKLHNMEAKLQEAQPAAISTARMGLGHTRWATILCSLPLARTRYRLESSINAIP